MILYHIKSYLSYRSFFRRFLVAIILGNVGFGLFFSVWTLAKYFFRFSGEVPFRRCFVSCSNVNWRPLFVVINKSPSFPNKTLNADITIIYGLFAFAHGSIFTCVSNNLQSPSIIFFTTFVLSNWLETVFKRVFCLEFFHQFLFVNFNTFRNVRF